MILTPFSPRRPKLPRYAECACGEYRKAALHTELKDGAVKCMNCHPRETEKRGACTVCKGTNLPLEDNHIGFAASPDVTELFCLNCHDVFSWKTLFHARDAQDFVNGLGDGAAIPPETRDFYISVGKEAISIMTRELESF